MHYKVTRQYPEDKQILFAQFKTLEHAKEFIAAKTADDEALRIKVIYRVYCDDEKIYEANKWNMRTVENALPILKHYTCKVSQVMNAHDHPAMGEFDDIVDAKKFIDFRLAADAAHNKNMTYQLYHHGKFDSEYKQATGTKTDSQSGNKSTLSFNPTPLSMSPSPGPRGFLINKKDKDEDEQKQ